VTSGERQYVSGYSRNVVRVDCPTGTYPLGGGGRVVYDYTGAEDSPVQISLQNSYPTATGWIAEWTNTSSWDLGIYRFVAHAVCATVQ
jgi:hypothetical protein